MNQLDDMLLNVRGFAFRDLVDQDKWESFDPVFGSLSVVGATDYSGRYRITGREVQFQVEFSAVTSIESAAGTDYLNLPVAAGGLAGNATMVNATTNVAVGVCVIDVTDSRCFLPTQSASDNTFKLAGWYEI